MIRRLLQLNGLAVLGVVLNHAVGWGFVAMFWWTNRYRPVDVPNFDQYGTLSYYALRAVEQIIIYSIPAFLLVSGFFMAVVTGRNQSTVGWRVIGSRILHLLIPYVLWSLIIFGADYLVLGVQHTPRTYMKLLLLGGATSAFYYVPLLCQLYLLSPLLVPLARNHWKVLLVASLLVQGYVQLAQYRLVLGVHDLPLGWLVSFGNWAFPGYLFWFSAGIVAGFHSAELKQWLTRKRWLLLFAAALTLPLGVLEWEFLLQLSGEAWIDQTRMLSDEVFSGTLILCFLAFSDVAPPFAGKLSELGTRSYGIYLTHSLVLLWTAKAIYRLEPWLLGNQLLYQLILITVGVAIPLALMALVNRSPARRYYTYIFG